MLLPCLLPRHARFSPTPRRCYVADMDVAAMLFHAGFTSIDIIADAIISRAQRVRVRRSTLLSPLIDGAPMIRLPPARAEAATPCLMMPASAAAAADAAARHNNVAGNRQRE